MDINGRDFNSLATGLRVSVLWGIAINPIYLFSRDCFAFEGKGVTLGK